MNWFYSTKVVIVYLGSCYIYRYDTASSASQCFICFNASSASMLHICFSASSASSSSVLHLPHCFSVSSASNSMLHLLQCFICFEYNAASSASVLHLLQCFICFNTSSEYIHSTMALCLITMERNLVKHELISREIIFTSVTNIYQCFTGTLIFVNNCPHIVPFVPFGKQVL